MPRLKTDSPACWQLDLVADRLSWCAHRRQIHPSPEGAHRVGHPPHSRLSVAHGSQLLDPYGFSEYWLGLSVPLYGLVPQA